MHLHAFYLGGSHLNANIEVHDMQFVVASDFKDACKKVKQKWFGSSDSVHIDAYGCLKVVDGFEVLINPKKAVSNLKKNQSKLFFVNIGATGSGFDEFHKNVVVVAKDLKEALLRQTRELKNNQKDVHKDNLLEVENVIDLSKEFSLELKKTDSPNSEIVSLYKKI